MSLYETALKNVMLMTRNEEVLTPELIRSKIAPVLEMYKKVYPDVEIDGEALYRDILSRCSVWIGRETILQDDEDHIIWLHNKKGSIPWKFWNRYQQYLEDEKGLPTEVIARLHSLTDNILGNLEYPTREGHWDRRGMVVGDVQSGKTSNYTGLICKAVDAGYKLVIVLAGMHNDLRSQTQLRLDEGFLGFDTQTSLEYNQEKRRLFGVGCLQEHGDLIVHSLTSCAEDGDYRTSTVRRVNFMIGGDPVLLVVKKNASVLRNLLQWIESRGKKDPNTGEIFIDGIPLLLIDDEADNASVDGKPPRRDENGDPIDDAEPTTINRLIRLILKTFKQSAYVGYTATPFANIFIYPPDENGDHGKYGEDLFPRSFIINLPAPSNYIGPSCVFGLESDNDAGIEGREALPIVKVINDYDHFFPNKHKKDWTPPALPQSLKEAIKVFILTCAARRVRGQDKEHNSMLVHVTRFTAVQEKVKELVGIELVRLQKLLEFGSGNASKSIIEEFKELWEREFVPITEEVMQQIDDLLIQPVKWDEIEKVLFEAAAKIQIKAVNGYAGDVLDYRNHKDGMSVIAVGGDKLSRGLTLDGLSVSYYLRASKMYDTLMQMGRWFGYRPGYLDLCRLYTSEELVAWYQHIAMANEELRKEFDVMAASKCTPMNYGLKVRTHPAGLQITSANKIRHGTRMYVSFADSLTQTVVFHKDEEILRSNYKHVENWLEKLGTSQDEKILRWNGIAGEKITEFLEPFIVHPLSKNAEPGNLVKYIRNQMRSGELTEWTVVLISSKDPNHEWTIAGHRVGLIRRVDSTPDGPYYMLKKRNLYSPKDELIDLTEDQKRQALENNIRDWEKLKKTKEPPKFPSGPYIRKVRSIKNGLLLLYPLDHLDREILNNQVTFSTTPIMGYAISFPASTNAKAVEYMVDTTYWRQLYGDE